MGTPCALAALTDGARAVETTYSVGGTTSSVSATERLRLNQGKRRIPDSPTSISRCDGEHHGCSFRTDHHRPLRGYALAGNGCIPSWGCRMSLIYIVSGVLTLGLFVYLLYAMFKPEKF